MRTGYKIKDVVERSGFSAATLRYYEEIGLLPESSRTPAGYRTYDDRTLARLAFIARAKQLGCSLDEIADLASAWEGDRCGPLQDRLRVAVVDKVARARRQVIGLTTLISELEHAAASLGAHRPDGACDDRCGCISITAVTGDDPTPITCTLGGDSLKARVEDWQQLLSHVADRGSIVDGVRVVFAASVPLDELIRLTAAEHDCCQFLDFAITVDTRGIGLEVTAPGDARPIVEALFGAPVARSGQIDASTDTMAALIATGAVTPALVGRRSRPAR